MVLDFLLHKYHRKGVDKSMHGKKKFKKSSLFALELQEDLTTGPCTQLEYLLVSQIIKYFR